MRVLSTFRWEQVAGVLTHSYGKKYTYNWRIAGGDTAHLVQLE
jgi:hypothetical protein